VTNFETVRELIALTFGISSDVITPETVQVDIPEWDSVGHLNLMVSLESMFNIVLELEDMIRLTSVAAILEYLETACPSQ